MKRALYVLFVLVVAAVGAFGWYRYSQYKKQVSYLLLKATFIEDYRRASEKYTPATVVSITGDVLVYNIPRQVIRNGEIYVDTEPQKATVTDATELFTFASTSLGLTPRTLPPGTPIRIQVAPDFSNPASSQALVIYVSQDATYPQDQ